MTNTLQIATSNPQYDSTQYVANTQRGIDKIVGKDAGKRFEWHADAIKKFVDVRNNYKLRSLYNELIAPCGAGKSSLQVALAILDVLGTRYGRKQLFVMPQCHISDGFFEPNGEYTNIKAMGHVYAVKCLPQHNFCVEGSLKSGESKIKGLIKWLTTAPKDLKKLCNTKLHEIENTGLMGKEITGLFAMTTNAALAMAFKRMLEDSPRKVKTVFHNVHLRLDESHHLAMGYEDNDLTVEESLEAKDTNILGEVSKHLKNNNDGTSALTLSTATNFRSDGKSIVWDSLRGVFNVFHREYAEHFKTLGVKSLHNIVTQFDKTPIEQLVAYLKREHSEYAYVAVPPRNVSWRKRFKENTDWGVNTLIAAIKKAIPGVRILNLVPDEERGGKLGSKQKLLDEPKKPSDGEPKYDIVITCMLGREGADWCPASRLHVTYPEGSLVLTTQTFGRLSRRFRNDKAALPWLTKRYAKDGKGKTTLIARYYYPTFPEPKRGMSSSQIFDGRKNALLAMLVATEDILPILFPRVPSKVKKGEKKSLAELIGMHKYTQLREEFLGEFMEGRFRDMSLAEYNHITDGLLKKAGVDEEHMEWARTTMRSIATRCADIQNFKNINVAFITEAGFAKFLVSRNERIFDFTRKQQRDIKRILREHYQKLLNETKAESKSIAKRIGHEPSAKEFFLHTKRKELVQFLNRTKCKEIRRV